MVGAWGPLSQENGPERRAEHPDNESLSLFSTANLGVEHLWFLPSKKASGLAEAFMSFRNMKPYGPWPFSLEPPKKFTFFTSKAVLAIRRHGA